MNAVRIFPKKRKAKSLNIIIWMLRRIFKFWKGTFFLQIDFINAQGYFWLIKYLKGAPCSNEKKTKLTLFDACQKIFQTEHWTLFGSLCLFYLYSNFLNQIDRTNHSFIRWQYLFRQYCKPQGQHFYRKEWERRASFRRSMERVCKYFFFLFSSKICNSERSVEKMWSSL